MIRMAWAGRWLYGLAFTILMLRKGDGWLSEMAILHKSSTARTVRKKKASDAASSRLGFMPLVFFLVFSALYCATRTAYNTFDAVSYSNQVAHLYPRTGDPHWLFHPHHLLFTLTGYVLWTLARACGCHGGPLIVIETFNAIVGALVIALFFVFLRRLMQRSIWLPFIVSTGLGLSFGYWICSTGA